METNPNIIRLMEMLETPEAHSEQEIRDIINSDDETREAYRWMVASKQGYIHKQKEQPINIQAAWQRFEDKHYPQKQIHNWMKIAASFIGVLLITGMAFAAVHILSPSNTQRSKGTANDSEPRMLEAFFVPKDSKRGDAIIVKWTQGTWIQDNDNSFIEEHSEGGNYMLHLKYNTIKLNGKELNIHNLPDMPTSALKKLEITTDGEHHWQANLITTPVQIPANIKGNVNPELTILLTGTVPKGAYQPVTIWQSKGIKDSYDWNDYFYTSWTGQWENVRIHLKEAANRKDHHVRINVCNGVPQKHLDRIKNVMQECGVTNYEFVNQE